MGWPLAPTRASRQCSGSPGPRVPNRSPDEQRKACVHCGVDSESELASKDDRRRAQPDEEGPEVPASTSAKTQRRDGDDEERRRRWEERSGVQQEPEAERGEQARVGRPASRACDLWQKRESDAGKRREARPRPRAAPASTSHGGGPVASPCSRACSLLTFPSYCP